MKRIDFPSVADASHVQRTSRWSVDRILALIRVIARAAADDQELALKASAKAEMPRKNLAEVRDMCVKSIQQSDEGGLSPDPAPRNHTVKRVQADFPCWSAPFPKPRK